MVLKPIKRNLFNEKYKCSETKTTIFPLWLKNAKNWRQLTYNKASNEIDSKVSLPLTFPKAKKHNEQIVSAGKLAIVVPFSLFIKD